MSWREALQGRECEISAKRLTVGFDGCVDTIVRPLSQTAAADQPACAFPTIRSLGEFLIDKAEKSCSIELHTEARQLGGNLPYLSRAAGGLGLSVSCIGMLGAPGRIDPLFADMPCTLYPYAPPMQSTCMEFTDGKVFLAPDYPLEGSVWNRVLSATGGRAPQMFREAHLLALVNWSELPFAHELWLKTLENLAQAQPDKSRIAFFDLCDISRRSNGECDSVLRIIGGFSEYRTTILSLNENEALQAGRKLLKGESKPAQIAADIRSGYGVDEIIIHTLHETLLATPRGITRQPTYFVKQPVISTGAGDNFNAASCFGAVMGLNDAERVDFANTFAHFYVQNGRSAALKELMTVTPHGVSR